MNGKRFMMRWRRARGLEDKWPKQLIIKLDKLPSPTEGQCVFPEHLFLPRHPSEVKRLWLIVDPKFTLGMKPVHHGNCFLEDKMHDWDYHRVSRIDEVVGIRYFGTARHSNTPSVRFLVEFEQ